MTSLVTPVAMRALQQVAAICSNILRDDDILGRLGGEEFALLLVNATLTAAVSVR